MENEVAYSLKSMETRDFPFRKSLERVRALSYELQSYCDSIKNGLNNTSRQIETEEKILLSRKGLLEKDIRSKQAELCSLTTEFGEVCTKIVVKKKKLGLVERSLEERKCELSVKEKEIEETKKLAVDLELKSKEISSWIEERNGVLRTIEENIQVKLAKEKDIDSVLIQQSLNLEWSNKELSLVTTRTVDGEQRLKTLKNSIDQATELLRKKEEQLCFVDKAIEKSDKTLSERSNQLLLLEKQVQEIEKKDLEKRGEEVEMKQKHIVSQQPQIFPENREILSPSTAQFDFGTGTHEVLSEQVDTLPVNRTSSHPPVIILDDDGEEVTAIPHDRAKRVLDFINKDIQRGCKILDEKFVKKCIIRFEQLMQNDLLQIKEEVEREAKQLADMWRREMNAKACKFFHILGFLQILAVYRLVKYFNRDEICHFLMSVAKLKDAPKLCRSLGFTDKVPDIINNLVTRELYMAAVRFICSFELMEEFSIKSFLEKEIEKIKRSACDLDKKGKCTSGAPYSKAHQTCNESVIALRELLECIVEFTLSSYVCPRAIAALNNQLRMQAEINQSTITLAKSSSPMFPSPRHKGFGASGFSSQQEQTKGCKRQRVDSIQA